VLNHPLTFAIFLVIGLEIRDGLTHARAAVLPTIAALGGMLFPALIFLGIGRESSAWAVVIPTDVALAIGALSILGSRVNPAVRLFLMTLAVADDFFSLVVIGLFFRNDLDIASAFYTIGAALIGALLPRRELVLRLVAPAVTFIAIPIYIWVNLFANFEISTLNSSTSLAIALSRIVGKVLGITFATWLAIRLTSLKLPTNLDLKEVAGVGLLSGMGMTVSLVIAEITVENEMVLIEIRSGLFLAAVVSALLGVLWLKRFPASL
jgi:NhaA family Na+:H+ antiporter